MKGMKLKFMKKLKSFGQIGSLKPGRVLQLNASDGLLDLFPSDNCSGHISKTPPLHEDQQPESDMIDIDELLRELGEDVDTMVNGQSVDKENICPPAPIKTSMLPKDNSDFESHKCPLSENGISGYRRPELNSGILFDPDLLSAFQKAVMDHNHTLYREKRVTSETQDIEKNEFSEDSLLEFEERRPPGGNNSVVLYTTSIRGIRKTFEDCSSIRFLLESLKVLYSERDVSMHLEFREELWTIMGGRVVPPRLFIKGRYLGGADEVLGLHEQGKLAKLLQGVPVNRSGGTCDECGGVCFILCVECSGSRKIIFDDSELPSRCPSCNENGLIVCPSCC